MVELLDDGDLVGLAAFVAALLGVVAAVVALAAARGQRQGHRTGEGQGQKLFHHVVFHFCFPPNLFDFFLFDGEEVGGIFSDDGYNKFIKDALLTLCGIDTYSIIQKFCSSYVGKSEDDVEQQINEEYAECMKTILNLTEKIEIDNARVQDNQQRIEELHVANEQLSESYKRAGGISEKDKSHIQVEIDRLDKKRNEISVDIKSFMEDSMPFYLLKTFNDDIDSQINFEEKDMISEYVRLMISKEYLKSILFL